MKKIFCLLFILPIFSRASAKEPAKPDYIINSRRIFEQAQTAFDDADYGMALKLSDEAKTARKQQIEWEVFTLQNSFKPAEVKYAGKNISDILPVLMRREDFDAIEIINRYEKLRGRDFFANSSENLIEYIQSLKEFPEAECLAGDIYRLEGEYGISEQYYTAAFKASSVLDIPDEKFDILYKLAEISRIQNDNEKYEKYLLLIAAGDPAFKDRALNNAISKTIRSTDDDCLEKFFKLYRVNNSRLLKAYFDLAEFYNGQGAKDRALQANALGVLAGFTKIYDVIKRRTPEFEYVSLPALLSAAASYEDVIEWGTRSNVWKGFNSFAEQAFRNDCPVFAAKLYSVLADNSPEDYWRADAAERLSKITARIN